MFYYEEYGEGKPNEYLPPYRDYITLSLYHFLFFFAVFLKIHKMKLKKELCSSNFILKMFGV